MPTSSLTAIELEGEVEGNQIGTKNYRFSKIGETVPIMADDVDSVFDPQSPPSQPLAVSERFGLLFVAHSNGFCVARTKDVIESAKKENNRPSSVQESSIVDLRIGEVSILTLSADSSTLVALVGAVDLHFFSISALLNKEQKPSFSCSVDHSGGIKDVRWTKKLEKSYVVLSSKGKLYYGAGQDRLKDVADNIDAVEWSVRGNFVAVARNNVLSILSSKFEEKLSMLLSFKSFVGDSDFRRGMKVDTIRWVRPDCIVIGCFQLADDGVEESYHVQVITSHDGKITNASSSPIVISFNDVFLGFIDGAVPFGSGPHMFLSYLDQCELAFIANRKNMDQHIVLFGWSQDDKKEAAMIEILNDAWLPRIDSQGNGDDNLILGLSIDKVSQDEQVKLTLGEEDKEVSPCCVLLCLTIDGKLTVFHFASAVCASAQQEAICKISEEEEAPLVLPAQYGPSEISSEVEEQSIEQVGLGFQSQETKEPVAVHKSLTADIPQITSHYEYSTGKQEVKHVLNSHAFDAKEQQKTPVVMLNQDEKGQQPTFSGQQGENFKQSILKATHFEIPRPVVKDLNKTETEKNAEVRSNSSAFSEKLASDMSKQSVHRDSPKGLEIDMKLPGQIGLTTVPGISIQSRSSGKIVSSRPADGRSSTLPSSGFQGKQSVSYDTILSNAHVPGGPPRNPLYSKDFVGSSTRVNSFGHQASTEGNIESLPVVHSSQIPLQENFTAGKSANRAANTKVSKLNSRPNLSKQILNVEEMAKELDTLMERIDGLDGFSDASIALQKSSVVALEEGILTLSERCRNWRGIMDERLRKIQLILDKTVQVLARKIYIEGIVKQATDSRYWDLWNRQKLSSELELKRRHLLEVNQDLTNQLIELERHFNSLELNKFGEVDLNLRAFQSNHGPSKHVNSLHSLHNTMSAQLAAAEQLSKCLSKQMAVLSIELPSMKKQNIRRELFETIGIPYDDSSFISPDEERGFETPLKNMCFSSSSSVVAKEQPWRNQSSAMKSSEPETARRRRDSLDRNWSSFNPPKTTVKRMLLQEDRQEENKTMSSLSVDNQLSDHEFMERSAAARAEQSSSLSTFLYPFKLKGTQDALTKESSLSQSTSWFKADELQNVKQSVMNSSTLSSQSAGRSRGALNHFATDESRSIQQSEIHLHQTPSNSTRFPARTVSSPEKRNAVSNSTDKRVGLSGFTIGNLKHETLITESSFSGKSSKIPFFPVLASGSASSLSDPGTSKSDPGELVPSSLLSFSSSASLPLIHSSSPIPSSFPKPTAPTWSSAAMSSGSSLTTSSTANVQTVSLHGSLASTSSVIASASFSQAREDLVASSVSPSLNFPSKSPSTEVPTVNLKTEKFEVLASSSQPKLQTGTSRLKLEASLPIKPTSEVSASSQSGSQLSLSDLASSVSHVAMEPKPEQSSVAALVLSSTSPSGSGTANDGKTDSPDVEFTQEDEMEEEAPEANQTTELTLGSLGGFGIGSAPNPTATKPNPFGAPFTNTSNPPNPPFTITVPGGELFKPASFSFQSPHPSQPSQPANYSAFTSGTATQISTGGFGHPAQTGSGQQALGSVLGSFGQSRQLGAGLPGNSVSSVSGFGGFVGTQSSGGFSNAAAGGGFASLASAGGGFSGLASAGGGFSGVASAGGGFGAAATAGGGFVAAPVAGGGFGGAASGTFHAAGGGFGAFGNQGSGGFSSFGGGGGVSERPPPHLVTQMRK